ncbi:hypothetical protein [Comamonas kerstersii]|uniref:hypothetical protein n=1 Tax=Comamonas kerstersii TaxID=225992 RepID=UPI001B3289D1|nr:hypothetical protein [Comamonas kerstersii]QTW18113.1 hypothetical protein H8N02_13005 [Comamonas kerstersii]
MALSTTPAQGMGLNYHHLDGLSQPNLLHCTEAEACKLAAVDELLEALKEAKAALEWCVEQGGGPVCEHESGAVCFCKESKAISSADAAIAKAQGEQS